MLSIVDLIKSNQESDERYSCYNLSNDIQIFNYLIQDDDLNDVNIYVSCDVHIDGIINEVTSYITWLSQCKNDLTMFYKQIYEEEVDDNWFDYLEVYRADLVFNNKDDYGATITCGDTVYLDYTMEIGFEKRSVDYIR